MPEPAEFTDMSNLESALRGLQPREDLDRPALWYRAGRASVRRGWAWPLATAASAALAAVLGFLLLTRPAERVVVYVTVPAPPVPPVRLPEPEPPSPAPEPETPLAVPPETGGAFSPSSLRLREQVLRWGLDGLPMLQEPAPSAPTETPASLLCAP
jgi:hypothetical protein